MTSKQNLIYSLVCFNLVLAQNKSADYVIVNYGYYSFYTNGNNLSRVKPTSSSTPSISINLHLQEKLSFNAKLGYINQIFRGNDQDGFTYQLIPFEVGMKEYYVFFRWAVEIIGYEEFVIKLNVGGYLGAIDAYTTSKYWTITYNKQTQSYETTHKWYSWGVTGGIEGIYFIPNSSWLMSININTHSAFRRYDYFIPRRFGFVYDIGLGILL